MGDAENNFQPSKKRAAGAQLSRDNLGLDDNDETSEQEAGTFKRASYEILAARRIVKVRRQQTSSTPSARDPPPTSNPFAAIRLVPSKETEQIGNNDIKSESEIDEPKGESTAAEEKTDVDDDNAKPSESTVDESKVEFISEKDETDIVGKNDAKKDVEGKRNDDENGNGELITEKNAETASFSSFQQLSGSQNAFSGLAGTGFSSTSLSFGSTPKDCSPLGSTFGTSGANIVSKSEGDKLPSMQEVPVETGEENETAVFTADSVLFEYIDGAWKERGKGELKVNVPVTGRGIARLIMRARGNYRLILNASLFTDMRLKKMDKKGVTLACVNTAAEGKDGLSTIALKFKAASIVEDFQRIVMLYKIPEYSSDE